MGSRQNSITESMASDNLNEMRRDFKDVACRRILIDLVEANSLQRVTVKLLIDFDSFLTLQHKLPDEYINKRLAITIPLIHFDDYVDEADILNRLIVERRKANHEPLNCVLSKRDKLTHRKHNIAGKVLDYEPKSHQYLIEEITPEKFRYMANRLCVQFCDFETQNDLEMRRTKDSQL